MLILTLVTLTILSLGLLAWYLRRLPEGPACPRCGAMARRPAGSGTETGRASFGRWTVAGSCPVCGWRGRMRRGPEPSPVRRPDRWKGAA